jgi:hypothetical protein
MARADDPTQQLDDSAPLQQARRGPRVSWLGLLGLLLALALLTVALIQARQYSALKATLDAGRDYSTLTLFESETEYLRLVDKWRGVADGRDGADKIALKAQYEAWVDRVALLHGARARALFDNSADHQQALAQMDAFVTAADRALGQQPLTEPTQAFVQSLLPALLALDEPLRVVAVAPATAWPTSWNNALRWPACKTS